MDNLVKIRDVSLKYDVTARTLRYYEDVGLIWSIRSEDSAYRLYDGNALLRLEQILILRKLNISIKDIKEIFTSENPDAVIEVLGKKVTDIDDEAALLHELKEGVLDFIRHVKICDFHMEGNVKKLYEMAKHIERQIVNADNAGISQVAKTPEVRLTELPEMRVLSSYTKKSEKKQSDADQFWQWINEKELIHGIYGKHDLFEYQEPDNGQTVTLLRVEDSFVNDSPYVDFMFEGGIFAVCTVYADEDINACRKSIIRSFDENAFFQVDYLHNGQMRHEALLETVLSPDETRERFEMLIPVRKRTPDITLFKRGSEDKGITSEDLEKENCVIQRQDVDITTLTPILDPYYAINRNGEVELASGIPHRVLSTNHPVNIPFRVDIVFKTNNASVRLYHGKASVVVNGGNVFDYDKSQESLAIKEPVFGTESTYKHKGSVNKNDYNTLTWIVGGTHFAILVNGEVRYCGKDHPYMQLDIGKLEAHPVIIGSASNEKLTIKSVAVSKIQLKKPVRIKEGAFPLTHRQSNNILPDLHRYTVDYQGQNYPLPGCMSYLMELLGEDREKFDYWFYSGLTGDNLTQIYCRDFSRTVFCQSTVAGRDYIGNLFNACGYEHTYVTRDELNANRLMFIETLMAYIDKGIPVLVRLPSPYDTALIIGYEEYGKSLLYLGENSDKPEKFDGMDETQSDWVFAGNRIKDVDISELYRMTVLDMPKLLKKNDVKDCSFGAQAFLDWADDIDNGRFDNVSPDDFKKWRDHDTYVCILATNASCLNFLERAQQQNSDLPFIADIISQFRSMAGLWQELEAVGGGFNATLDFLKDKEKRKLIAGKIRKFAGCYELIYEILIRNIK